jgi:hypothetical protein
MLLTAHTSYTLMIGLEKADCTNSSRMATSLLTALDRDGSVLIPSTVTQNERDTLRSACDQVAVLARAGRWPYIRAEGFGIVT